MESFPTQQVLQQGDLSEQERMPVKRYVAFSELFRYADTKDWIFIIIAAIFSCGSGASFPIFAVISGDMIDKFNGSPDLVGAAAHNLYLYLGLGAASMVVGFIMFSLWTIIGERQAIKLRKQYFRSLMRQEIAWFDLQNQISISTDFQVDSMTFQLAVGQKISAIISILSMLFVGVGVSLYSGWIFGLVLIAYIPILIALWTKKMHVTVETDHQSETIYRNSDSKSQQTFSAIKLVKQLNGEQYQCSIQKSILDSIKQTYSSTIKRYTIFTGLSGLSIGLFFPLAFWYGSQCVFDSALCPQRISTSAYTAGSVTKILYCLLLPAINLNQLTPCFEKITQGRAAAKRIFDLIDRVPLITSKASSIKPENFKGQIQFREVTFAYPKEKSRKILDKLNLKIDCRHSAFVGASGCGKSTVFQLIMRFYDPDQGAILLDGADLRDLDLEWLRSQIGLVTQEPVLFASSIKQNLLLGKPEASDQEIYMALKKAEAYDFVYEFPSALDTFVGSGGSQLSGGQKQRIAIARSLLKGSKLILLDEATSALDRKNQRNILQTLRKLQSDFISISITHRKTVLNSVEKFYRFKDGKVIDILDVHKKEEIIRSDKGLRRTVSIRHRNSLKSQGDENEHFEEDQYSIDEELQNELRSPTLRSPTLKSPKKTSKKLRQSQNPQFKLRESQESQEVIEDNKGFSRLTPYFMKQKLILITGVICSILNGFCFPSFGIIMAKVLVEFFKYQSIPNFDTSWTKILCLIGVAIAIVDTITNTASRMLFGILSKNAVCQIRNECYQKIVRMPLAWFERKQNSPEKVTSEMTISCKELYGFMKSFMCHIFGLFVSVLFSFVGSTVFEWRTGLTSIGLLPLIILAQAIQMSFVEGMTESKSKIYRDSVQTIKESVLNIRTVLSLNAEKAVYDRYDNQLSVVIDNIKNKAMLSGVMYGIGLFFQFFCCAMIFFMAAVYIDKNSLDVQGPLLAIFLILFASVTAGNKATYLSDVSATKGAITKIFSFIELEDQLQIRQNSGCKQLKTPIKGNIEFRNVDYQYESRDEGALSNLNLKVSEGENLWIVGGSGGGKSTIFSLLQGLYIPTDGKITLEGVDIKDYDLHHLRKAFGVVSQEPLLFNQSIDWNIRYNLTEATEQDILSVCEIANYNPMGESMALIGTNTSLDNIHQSSEGFQAFKKNVGPKGSHVSGGQKQRIAIARAMLRSPSVLLLDQATSALDHQNQAIVQKSLEKNMKGKTTLAITHKLEQVYPKDRVVVVDQGRVEEDDTYEHLAEIRSSRFWKMLKGIPFIEI